MEAVRYTETDRLQFSKIRGNFDAHAAGMKRGRKIQGFHNYCERTTEKIKNLKAQVQDPATSDVEKNRLRNQISAYQARLKQRISNLD